MISQARWQTIPSICDALSSYGHMRERTVVVPSKWAGGLQPLDVVERQHRRFDIGFMRRPRLHLCSQCSGASESSHVCHVHVHPPDWTKKRTGQPHLHTCSFDVFRRARPCAGAQPGRPPQDGSSRATRSALWGSHLSEKEKGDIMVQAIPVAHAEQDLNIWRNTCPSQSTSACGN